MTDLIAVLSTGKGTWTHVAALIKAEDWENIHLITNAFGKEKFSCEKPVNMVVLDQNASVDKMQEQIVAELKDKVKVESAVNLFSGNGKEHMAVLGALMKMGVGMRFVVENDGMKEL